MKRLIIEIDTCYVCPHAQPYRKGSDNTVGSWTYKCNLTDFDINRYFDISESCPLDDVQDK